MTAKKTKAKTPAADKGVKLVDLSEDDVRALAKPRIGFEKHAASLASIYSKHSKVLGKIKASPAGIAANMGAWRALEAIEKAALKHAEMATETRMMHAAQAWSSMLEIYDRAKSAGRTHPEIASAIEEFEKFMSTGPRPKKPTP